MVSDTNQRAEKRFVQIFCLLFVILGLAVFMFKRTDLFPWVGACNAAGYDHDHYLAYCHNTRYGDYEHFALYNALEPRAVDALKEARVLFLGNSNTQYAFSTRAVADFFESAGVSHYLMGFGQGAQSPVAAALMAKHDLHPELVVANVDPFFSEDTNGTFQRVLRGGKALDNEHDRKQRLQRWQAGICSSPEARLFNWVCKGDAETLYRNRENGHWRTDYYRDNAKHPVSNSDDLVRHVALAATIADEFIAKRKLRRECVLLTVTPKTNTPRKFAVALAKASELPLIAPELDALVTIDHSHLDPESAERWSMAFMDAAAPYIERCTGAASHATLDDVQY